MPPKDRTDRIETIFLPVKLTEEEKRDRALEAARLRSERERDEYAEEARKKAEKARIGTVEATERACLRAVETGEELRPTDCEWSAEGKGRLMQLRRMDTGEVVRTRPMSDTELAAWAQGDLESWLDRQRAKADDVMSPGDVIEQPTDDAAATGNPKQLGPGPGPRSRKRRDGGEASA